MSLALYRKYRPATFAEVRGQEHATGPLTQALSADRVHHAYLFSGPRGCGKTSSARIMARSLNCAQGPTPEPCGVCDSCVGLAPNGAGRLDVIEIDAASHGRVDDARDLRDSAHYSPVADRYKVYIIDEAHMVTDAAFNALLKLVEEPPDFVKFIFATTEPENVLTTIKSRTHHYAFRLVPPPVLRQLLADVCEAEKVTVDPLALPLIVRAGAGSVRDSLSVLDQLVSGVGPEGLTYTHALAQLGVTAPVLLDEVVDALAVGDAATIFLTIERLVESGHDVRRFATDLLDRLRDLVLLDAVPAASDSGLVVAPPEEIERMIGQARAVGTAGLARAASLLADGLTEMRGATAPRLVLELVVARILLTAGDRSVEGVATRVEQLERRLMLSPPPSAPSAAPSAAPSPTPPVRASAEARVPVAAPVQAPPRTAATPPVTPTAPAGSAPGSSERAMAPPADAEPPADAAQSADARQAEPPAASDDGWPETVLPGTAPRGPAAAAAPPKPVGDQVAPAGPPTDGPDEEPAYDEPEPWADGVKPPVADAEPLAQGAATSAGHAPEVSAPTEVQVARPDGTAPGTVDSAGLRRVWPDVLEKVKAIKRTPYAMLSDAQVVAVEGPLVQLGFPHGGLSRRFSETAYVSVLVQALTEVLGGTWRVECTVLGEEPATPGSASSGQPAPPRPAPEPVRYDGFADGDEAVEEDPDDPTPQAVRRQPEDVAVALLQEGLGARPVDDPRR